MRRMVSLRWAFRCGAWEPTRDEWIHGMACVQPEEQERIRQFAFRRDAKFALAGRLLIRKAVSESLGIPYANVQLGRTEKGRPYLINSTDHGHHLPGFDFNISHQGEYVVLAAESSCHVGIDLMKVDPPAGCKTTEQFFSTMTRQFTKQEWEEIRRPSDEFGKLANFYRFWCLKESFVKLVGIGIGYSLRRLNFVVHSTLMTDQVICDTEVEVDGRLQKEWTFEETQLDDRHVVAVALRKVPQVVSDLNSGSVPFSFLTTGELFSGAAEQCCLEPSEWEEFYKKPPFPQYSTASVTEHNS